ncbi:MAG: 30S ribosomal protein S8 [Candidatus Omnitrophica bacterium]|nr:30S ribosomal protein S8 [Candidatus Omnitrophota bacterium]MCM8826867.1 30S ribosomal protein S8 [Candidatus Omnitrophota bacterium]
MSRTYLISDALAIINNASKVNKDEVIIPYSKVILGIMDILKKESYIDNFKEIDLGGLKRIKVYLKYENKQPVINEIKMISKPGRRIYTSKSEMPIVRSGYGIAIVSTSQGILTSTQAKKLGIGGEILCYIW